MRKLLLLLLLIAIHQVSLAQVSRNPNNANYLRPANIVAVKNAVDGVRSGGVLSVRQPQLDEIQQRDSVNIQFIGLAGASSVEELKKVSGSVSLGISLAWGKHMNAQKHTDNAAKADKDQGYRLYQRNTFYMLFNPATVISRDTQSVQKAYLFPVVSKRDFVIGYERIFPFSTRRQLSPQNNIVRPATFSLFTELSTGHYDTGMNQFRTYNFAGGLKFTFHTTNAGLPLGFQIIPNYNLINVEPKNWDAMDLSLLGKHSAAFDTLHDKGIPPTVQTLGIDFKLSVSVFEIFADFKTVLGRKWGDNANIPADMKNTSVLFGVLINPDVWGFNVPTGPGNDAE